MGTMDLGEPDSDDVVIGRSGEATVAFGRPDVAGDGSVTRLPVRLSAGGVSSITRMDLAAWSDGSSRLIAYFDDLAASWQGWDGAREFGDDGPNVSMSATHDRIGLVKLVISEDPYARWDGPGAWRLRVVVPIDPGALEQIAKKIRLLLGPPC